MFSGPKPQSSTVGWQMPQKKQGGNITGCKKKKGRGEADVGLLIEMRYGGCLVLRSVADAPL